MVKSKCVSRTGFNRTVSAAAIAIVAIACVTAHGESPRHLKRSSARAGGIASVAATGSAVSKVDPGSHMRYAGGAIEGDFTLMAMFKITADRDTLSTFLIMGGPREPVQRFLNSYAMSTDHDGTTFRMQGVIAEPGITGPDLGVGGWHHLALVGNTTPGSPLYGYIDGVFAASGTSDAGGTYIPEMIEIAGCWGQDVYRLAGSFCALKAWNVKLDPIEIQTEMGFYRAVRKNALWQEVPLRNSDDLLDLSGNSRDLVATGPAFEDDAVGPDIAFESSAPDCSSLNDQCHIGVYNESTSQCGPRTRPDGAMCDDGLFCTVEDACQSGVCVSSTPRDCSAQGDQCHVGICDENLNECLAHPLEDGTPCDDGLYCTASDSCQAGVCVGGPSPCPHLCDEPFHSCVECLSVTDCVDGVACTDEACEHGVCFHTPNNASCPDDGNFCNGHEVCNALLGCISTGDPCPEGQTCNEADDTCGECLEDADCNDGVDCTENHCVNNGCVYTPVDANCFDDGQFCNGHEVCDAVLGCVSTGGPCLPNEFCNEANDRCDQCLTEADCNHSDPCIAGRACIDGQCGAGLPVDCSTAGDQCSVASCDPVGAPGNCDRRTPVDNGTPCDDGLYCTINDACQAGACASLTPRNCSELSDLCHVGICNEEVNACVPQTVDDGSPCNDGLFCTVNDQCEAGECRGAARDCSEIGDACNLADCNEDANACETHPADDGTTCDDGNACTSHNACNNSACVGELLSGLPEWHGMSVCIAGPNAALQEGCECSDLNHDGHVDLRDVEIFMVSFTSP